MAPSRTASAGPSACAGALEGRVKSLFTGMAVVEGEGIDDAAAVRVEHPQGLR